MAATTDLAAAVAADLVLVVVPAQALRAVAQAAAPLLRPGTPLVICAKGIERGTGRFLSEVIAEVAPAAVPAVLSGPSFAADIDKALPTAVTVAAGDEEVAQRIAQTLGSPTFRLYHTTDVRGVEIGGATKNVLAIAAGIVAGRKLGASATAAITARGFAELSRFGAHFGAKPQTLMGLSGLGDLILSCSSLQSATSPSAMRSARARASTSSPARERLPKRADGRDIGREGGGGRRRHADRQGRGCGAGRHDRCRSAIVQLIGAAAERPRVTDFLSTPAQRGKERR